MSFRSVLRHLLAGLACARCVDPFGCDEAVCHDGADASTAQVEAMEASLLQISQSYNLWKYMMHLQDNPIQLFGGSREQGRVLYVMYSDSTFYNTRVQWVMDTWAKALPRDAFVIIGDSAADGELAGLVQQTRCPPHSHWEGACCKYAEAVIEAHVMMSKDPSLQWAYFTDDDAYVRPAALEAVLNSQNPSSSGVVLGTWGCIAGSCTHGLCAGGGYAADRVAISAMVGSNATSFLRSQMDACGRCNRWADMALSELMKDRGVDRRALPGLFAWRQTKSKFDERLSDHSVEPLMFHYVKTWPQMELLHRLFSIGGEKQDVSQLVRKWSNPRDHCAYYKGTIACATSDAADAVPWQGDQ